ncbi:ATP-grasp domain-containing protein [Ureibacillus composti]|nr:ATP-grasp domain-containing protein [Ureibacillus composti]
MGIVENVKDRIAILGWSQQAIEAIGKMNRPYIVVAPFEFQAYANVFGIPFIPWQFEWAIEEAHQLYETLKLWNTKLAIPIYEETVEWAGAINAKLENNPRLFQQSMLFRDKGLMKRKAQLAGMRVGIFEEAQNKQDIYYFLKRMNETMLKVNGEVNELIHVKPFNKAGTVGHRIIQSAQDIEAIDDQEFPLLMESHLNGKEFCCEVFVHNCKIRFLNITEYVKLGHSNFVPASPSLEKWRANVTREIEKLVDAFEFNYGILHAEFFVTSDGTLNFGEVGARVPGGHIFEHIERVYGFNPFQGQILCSDPDTTDAEIEAFFPEEVVSAKGYAGIIMVYPHFNVINQLTIPEKIKNHPYYVRHEMFNPDSQMQVPVRVGTGNHYGSIYFFGQDADEMSYILNEYLYYDFYK